MQPRHRENEPGSVHATTMDEILATLRSASPTLRCYDGWRHPLLGGVGFRHDYDAEVARGGWEFYLLGRGLSLAIVDFVACRSIPRRHGYGDHLVLSAVLEGTSHIVAPGGAVGDLLHGYCTVYGMEKDAQFELIYEPGKAFKWVSVFIERSAFCSATGLEMQDLPADISEFLINGSRLPHRNIPLSSAASMVATQILQCAFEGGFRRAFLTAKSLELACNILHMLSSGGSAELGRMLLRDDDYPRLAHARQLLEKNLETPPNVSELAAAAGLTRQKLQLGFRLLYGDTVGQIRDKLRMEHALTLVRESPLPLIEVALDCGYEHAASFTRAFKATYGVSPARVRRVARESVLIGKIHKS
jgi:AraC-like DNA-binding protein